MEAQTQTFQERIASLVDNLTTQKTQLQEQILKIDSQITKLSLLSEGNDDPDFENLLLRTLTARTSQFQPQLVESIPTPAPFSEPQPISQPPAPPSKRVRVTCDGIYAITQTFSSLFTLNDVVDLLADNEGVVDPEEKRRVRSACYTMMRKLIENGRLIQAEAGAGKRQALFRKVATSDYRRLPAFRDGKPEDIEVQMNA